MHERHINITAGQDVTLSGSPSAVASDTLLPVTYDKFASMVQPGDTVYIGRCAAAWGA
jgi:pyruvate kinase